MKNRIYKFKRQQWHLLPLLFICTLFKAQPIANVIANGSFEEVYNCTGPSYPLTIAKYWLSIDSTSVAGGYFGICNGSIPLNGNTYQFPHTGNAYVMSTFYYGSTGRGYLKNRMRQNLQAGKTYCAKFYVNITNTSTYGMDGFGVYFGNDLIDTITKCTIPLPYISPQVDNTAGNIISDTLDWVPVTGTFVANGTEKYALIGNFKSNAAIDTALINPTNMPLVFTDVCIDDVSCFDIDLPAYAGRDTSIVPSASVYIGQQSDVGIDEACTWYQLPNISTPIATGAGLWVNPIVTTTYVVRQQLWCSGVLWDTVVVNINPVGFEENSKSGETIDIFPVPATNELDIRFKNAFPTDQIIKVQLFDAFGRIVYDRNLTLDQQKTTINIQPFPSGVYLSRLRNSKDDLLKSTRIIIEK